MSGLKKSLVFFVSFFATLALISIISYAISPFLDNIDNQVMRLIIYPTVFSIALIFFVLLQGLLKYYINKKILDENTVLFKVHIEKFNLNQRLWLYILAILIYFVQLFKAFSFNFLSFVSILLFLATLVILEGLIRFSKKTVKIYFLRNGILVTGFDIRIELPFVYGTEIFNDSGFYEYADIDGYFIFSDHMDLFLVFDQGRLTFKIDDEIKRQALGLFKEQKIKMKTYI